MKYFYLITNEVKDPEGFYTRKITAYLAAHGGKVVCAEHAASYSELCKPDLAKPEVPDWIFRFWALTWARWGIWRRWRSPP